MAQVSVVRNSEQKKLYSLAEVHKIDNHGKVYYDVNNGFVFAVYVTPKNDIHSIAIGCTSKAVNVSEVSNKDVPRFREIESMVITINKLVGE